MKIWKNHQKRKRELLQRKAAPPQLENVRRTRIWRNKF